MTATTGFGDRSGWMAAARRKVSIFSGEPSSTYVEFQIEVGGNNILYYIILEQKLIKEGNSSMGLRPVSIYRYI